MVAEAIWVRFIAMCLHVTATLQTKGLRCHASVGLQHCKASSTEVMFATNMHCKAAACRCATWRLMLGASCCMYLKPHIPLKDMHYGFRQND